MKLTTELPGYAPKSKGGGTSWEPPLKCIRYDHDEKISYLRNIGVTMSSPMLVIIAKLLETGLFSKHFGGNFMVCKVLIDWA